MITISIHTFVFTGRRFFPRTVFTKFRAERSCGSHNAISLWQRKNPKWTWRSNDRPLGLPAAPDALGVAGHPSGAGGSNRHHSATFLLLARQRAE